MIPVLCLLLRSSHARLLTQCTCYQLHLQSLRLAMLPARSELSDMQQSSLLNCALCPQSSCHSNAAFFKLGHSSSWHHFPGTSCDWHPLTPFNKLNPTAAHMRSRPSWTSGVAPILRIHLLILLLAAFRHWVALSDELPAHSLEVSFALFACGWRCSYLSRVSWVPDPWLVSSRVLGSRSLAVLLSSRPFRHVFHQTVVNFSFRITVADPWMDPAQF